MITIKDIAKVAGVSHSTVSRALNDSPQISDKTKLKIRQISESLNFQFNAHARSLSNKKTRNVAVVYQSLNEKCGSSIYINQLFSELRDSLAAKQIDTIFLGGYNPKTGESNIKRAIQEQKADGFLIFSNDIKAEDYDFIKLSNLFVIQLHMPSQFYHLENLNYFIADQQRGGFLATDHLINCGCNNILTVRPNEENSAELEQRTLGYKRAHEKNKIPIIEKYIISTENSFNGGYELFDKFPQLLSKADGIFFQTDLQAFGFLASAKDRNIEIPEKYQVIGFDDIYLCEYTRPSLSTIHQPRKEIIELACNQITDLISGNKENTMVQKMLSPQLIIRQTTVL